MANKLYEENSVRNIANAIRTKNGSETKYKIAEMAQAILDIPAGGELQEKSVVYTADGAEIVTPDAPYNGLSKVNINVDVLSFIIEQFKNPYAPNNTIYINAEMLDKYTFSPDEPSNPQFPDIWLKTVDPGRVKINVLNTGNIIIPISAVYQYDGEWLSTDWAIKLDGVWHDMITTFFPRQGAEWEGGVVYPNTTLGSFSISNNIATCSVNNSNTSVGIMNATPYNLTYVNNIRVYYSHLQGGVQGSINIRRDKEYTNVLTTHTVTSAEITQGYADVNVSSITGNCYIAAGCRYNKSSGWVSITKIEFS